MQLSADVTADVTSGGMQLSADVTIQNDLPIYKSRLLAEYARIDPRLKQARALASHTRAPLPARRRFDYAAVQGGGGVPPRLCCGGEWGGSHLCAAVGE